MPRAKRPTPKEVNEKGGYINFKITEEERGQVREWATTADELWEQIARLLDSQYQFKVSYDDGNDCYVCYIQGHWKLNKPDANWTLIGRGSSWEKAVRQALWMHFEGLGGEWQTMKNKSAQEKNWD